MNTFPRWMVRERCEQLERRSDEDHIRQTDGWFSWGSKLNYIRSKLRRRLICRRRKLRGDHPGWKVNAIRCEQILRKIRYRQDSAWRVKFSRVASSLNANNGPAAQHAVWRIFAFRAAKNLNRALNDFAFADRTQGWAEAFGETFRKLRRLSGLSVPRPTHPSWELSGESSVRLFAELSNPWRRAERRTRDIMNTPGGIEV